MADILLKNKDGEQVLHQNRTSVSLNKSGGGTVTFTEGEAQQKTVALSMYENGQLVDQVIQPDQGKVLTQVTVSRPSTLTSANIKKDIVIGGVTGAYEGTDTSDANAEAGDIWQSKTAYVNGVKKTGTLYSDTIIREGDTLSALYFSGEIDDIIESYAITEGLTADLTVPLLICGDINDSTYAYLHSDITVVTPGSEYDVATYLTISSSGIVKDHLINALASFGIINLPSGMPAVSYVNDLTCRAVSPTPRCYGGSLASGAGVYMWTPFKDGFEINELHFNTSLETTSALNLLLSQLPYSTVHPDTQIHYTRIGFDYLCAADLSSVGLGQGYVLYWGYDMTIVYSTIPFDASAMMPGMVVTNAGWQRSSIELTTSSGNPIAFNPNQFASWPLAYNFIQSLMMTEKYGYPIPTVISASGSNSVGIPYGVSPSVDFYNLPDASLDVSSLCIFVLDASSTGQGVYSLTCAGINNSIASFTGYDPNSGNTLEAQVTISSGTLSLTGIFINGMSSSALIPLTTWKITIIKF